MSDELDAMIGSLEQVSERLRAGTIDDEEAAALVERCAELAADIGRELDRAARAGPEEEPAGQERLV